MVGFGRKKTGKRLRKSAAACRGGETGSGLRPPPISPPRTKRTNHVLKSRTIACLSAKFENEFQADPLPMNLLPRLRTQLHAIEQAIRFLFLAPLFIQV
jgi:hypothetical protein